MPGFTKLFNSILSSTVWREPLATKVVWITMLALADRDGIVEAALPGLAHLAGVDVDQATGEVVGINPPRHHIALKPPHCRESRLPVTSIGSVRRCRRFAPPRTEFPDPLMHWPKTINSFAPHVNGSL
jgi:hypothetical protein